MNKLMKKYIGKWLIALFLLPLMAIDGSPELQKTQPLKTLQLVYALPNQIATLDPIKAIDTYTVQVIGQVLEGLAGLNGHNQVIPLLAKRWAMNSKGDVWTFFLRKNVWFHRSSLFGAENTRRMTAADVRYSFERLLRKDAAQSFALAGIVLGATAYRSGKQKHVSGIRVLDQQTIEFRLIRPERTFVNRITSPWFPVVARESAEKDDFGLTQLIGTGPYWLRSRRDTEVVVEKNNRYWRNSDGNIEKIRFIVLGNEQLRLYELKNGRVDIMQLSPTQSYAIHKPEADGQRILKDSWAGTFQVSSFNTFNIHLIGFNTEKLDPALRRAISLAIDRKVLVQIIANGSATVASGPVPGGLPGYTPAFVNDLYKPDKAARELAKSEYSKNPRPLQLLVHDQAASEQIGTLIQAQLARQGINIQLQKVDFNTAVGRIIKGQTELFSIFIEFVFSSPDHILDNLFNSAKIPVPNFWHYSNKAFDAGLETLWRSEKASERSRIAHGLERMVTEDAPAVFLLQMKNELIHPRNLHGLSLNGHNVPLLWRVQR